MRINTVVSIAQLEPAPQSTDSFHRKYALEPPFVQAEGDEASFYEIERLIGKRVTRGKIQYLVSWKGYNDSHKAWCDQADLSNAKEAINDYEAWIQNRPSPRRHNMQSRPFLLLPASSS